VQHAKLGKLILIIIDGPHPPIRPSESNCHPSQAGLCRDENNIHFWKIRAKRTALRVEWAGAVTKGPHPQHLGQMMKRLVTFASRTRPGTMVP
jgi:hypothetical protein